MKITMLIIISTIVLFGNSVSSRGRTSRLNGLKWLATHGCDLPAGVERILVMDATDLKALPLKNGEQGLPSYVDVEAFWRGENRKPTRVLLRRGNDAQARVAAELAATAAQAAAEAQAQAEAQAAAEAQGDARMHRGAGICSQRLLIRGSKF